MKVCLYLELESMLGVSGIGSAINNQRTSLEYNGVEYTSDLNDDFDVIHINVVGPKSLYLAWRMKKKGKKVILHAHVTADDFKESYKYSTAIAPYLKRYLTFYYNQADLVLCPSEYTRNVLTGYGVEKEIRVISNGIDIEKFKFSDKKRKEFRDEHTYTGQVPFNVGHLFLRKGLESFVGTAKSMKDNKFLWVGRRFKKLEDSRVKKLIDKAPENVLFMSYVKDIVAVYCGCDVFYFPSWCENQGIVLLEAAACKKPIVVRDIATYDGWLVDGVNCLKGKTDAEFKAKLKQIMDDPDLAKTLSENAYQMSREHSLQKVGAKLKGIYEDLCNGGSCKLVVK
jgi:1,2-diacylglycerol-3-alpha-glucose alpha-1,2-glucosyltransferase